MGDTDFSRSYNLWKIFCLGSHGVTRRFWLWIVPVCEEFSYRAIISDGGPLFSGDGFVLCKVGLFCPRIAKLATAACRKFRLGSGNESKQGNPSDLEPTENR